MKQLITLFFTAVAGAALWSQTPYMVKDIYNDGQFSSTPFELCRVGNLLFFQADDGIHGKELWKSDGTAAGTVMVKDINPGATGSMTSWALSFIEMGGKLYFAADDGAHGVELWKSDGTTAGTVLVKDIDPQVFMGMPIGSYPHNLIKKGSTLFFTAGNGTSGIEMWKSDGTTAGTTMVADINPGDANSSPNALAVVGDYIYFSAAFPTGDGYDTGDELGRTDGTAAGTMLIKDIVPGPNGSSLNQIRDLNGTAIFIANSDDSPELLWKSDGTEAGTVILKDMDPLSTMEELDNLTLVNGKLYFLGDDGTHGSELWTTDGTVAGTVLVKDINPGAEGSFPTLFYPLNSTTFVFNATTANEGMELFKSDGTAAGTVLVKDIAPGIIGSIPAWFCMHGGAIYFSAFSEEYGAELWRTDGSSGGTTRISDINPGTFSGSTTYMTSTGSHLFFVANDGDHGTELWSLDGEAGLQNFAGFDLLLYPNPGNGTFAIHSTGEIPPDATLTVCDIAGKEVYRTADLTGTITLEGIDVGTYFCRIATATEMLLNSPLIVH